VYPRGDDGTDSIDRMKKMAGTERYPRGEGYHQQRGGEVYPRGGEVYPRGDDASESLDRMRPEDVYDSIRRTTADIRHYVKMESSNTASPPPARTGGAGSSQRRAGRDGRDGRDDAAGVTASGSYHLPVTRSPDKRGARQRYAAPAQVCSHHTNRRLYLFFNISDMLFRPRFLLDSSTELS